MEPGGGLGGPPRTGECGRGATLAFHPQLYEVPGEGKPFGAAVASTAFLAALARHGGPGPLAIELQGGAPLEAVAALLHRLGLDRPVQAIDPAAAGALHLPNPMLAEAAWRRHGGGPARWSLTGVVHALAGLAAFDAVAAMVTAPVAAWDALVCPSSAVRAAVVNVLESEQAYLSWRLGAPVQPALPVLPVIPLGIDAAARAPDGAERIAWRTRLGIAADDVVLLYVGRLSATRKADPMALCLAAEAAARRRPERLWLIQAGWFADHAARAHFERAASELCPSVRTIFLDGRAPAVRAGIWSAADIFVSLVDNVQETFGLTPLEAMAAGLPVVASDWDGYRETVRDGRDGFLVPTAMPSAPWGEAILDDHVERRIDGAGFQAAVAATVTVDVEAAAAAIARLAGDPALRRRMGEAGRERASQYDWVHVVARYGELWTELAERRAGAPPPDGPPRGGRIDPYGLFARHPSRAIAASTVVRLAPGVAMAEAVSRCGAVLSGSPLFPTAAEYAAMLQHLAGGPASPAALARLLAPDRMGAAVRGVARLAKVGIVTLEPTAP
ncbi:MAG: glycosyltransferase family 4 protein [Alphaproteobacteria bacterium]|nr:glycosyltransferase family 4 protein [Alphaproteobacteria bacterium]